LANTYRDCRQYDLAITYYKKRIEIGGWIEEVWQSYYNIGKCYQEMGDFPNALYYWLEGFQVYPKRIENLYKIVQSYRCEKKYRLAYQYYLFAKRILEKNGVSNDFLFLENDVYEYKLDYEFSILGYYENPDSVSMTNLSMKLLACSIIEENISRNILSNYKFYVDKLRDKKTMDHPLIIKIKNTFMDGFESSTPSLCILNNQLIINTRYVNYRIDDQGCYINQPNITTKNMISVISMDSFEIISEFLLGYNDSQDNLYVGLEDVRLFSSGDGILLYNANRGLGNSRMQVQHGCIDLNMKTTQNDVLLTFDEKQCEIEKNWVLFSTGNKTKCIYNWSPLVIGDIQNKQFMKTSEQRDLPDFFRYIRGSTNGQVMDDEIWFISHMVNYESRRYYYHIMIVLDKTTFALKKYSPLFTFEGHPVEYTLGFVPIDNDLLIGYSVLDRETKYIMVSTDWFKSQMYIV
jgi:hypothetical protein